MGILVREITANKIRTIANPTSAFFKAGPSLVPSPVTATTSRVGFIFDAIIPLTRTYLS
jgi:transcriptional/translational regulatory protein YebC/TACO1